MTDQERIAIVTGASAGIGRAIAESLCRNGTHVVANARGEARLAAVHAELERTQATGSFVPVTGDITHADTLARLFDTCSDRFETSPDIFVVNAGHGLPGSLLGSDEELWDAMFQTDTVSALRQMRAAAAVMRERSRAAKTPVRQDIVVIGSVVGRNISPVNPVYGAAKFALHSAAEALRREVAPDWIRVTVVAPGAVRTEFQTVAKYDMERFDAAESASGPFLRGVDVARLVQFVVDQPAHVHLNEVAVRPTRQVLP